jgi:acetyl esterase/lipase
MSLKGKMMHYTLKYRHLLKGKLRPEVIDQHTSIEKLREDCDTSARRFFKAIPGIDYVPTDFPDFYAEWVRQEGAPMDQVVLYFHGGGFVMGNAQSHRNIVGNFVRHLGISALVFDYRLAPEHPAPAAATDGTAIYAWLLQQGYSPKNIVFAGDSAGAGVALSTLLKCKDDQLPLPAACALYSPCTDMTCSGESHITRQKKDPCTPKGANETYLGYYVGAGDPRHPYCSPLFGDLEKLPPMIIQVGDNETLRDDATGFAKAARAAGVTVELEVYPGMFHCFPLLAPMFPEATKALSASCQFLRNQLNC